MMVANDSNGVNINGAYRGGWRVISLGTATALQYARLAGMPFGYPTGLFRKRNNAFRDWTANRTTTRPDLVRPIPFHAVPSFIWAHRYSHLRTR